MGAELAAGGRDGDFGEALRADLGSGWSVGDWALELVEQIAERHDDEEVDDRGLKQEVDDGVEELAIEDLAAVDEDEEVAEAGLADDGRDERCNDVGGQSGNDRAEGCADDDSDCEIDDVAAKDEVTKAFEHRSISEEGCGVLQDAAEYSSAKDSESAQGGRDGKVCGRG